MARPIRNTPILFGEDAREFERRINTPIPLEERIRMRKEVDEGAAKAIELITKINRKKEARRKALADA